MPVDIHSLTGSSFGKHVAEILLAIILLLEEFSIFPCTFGYRKIEDDFFEKGHIKRGISRYKIKFNLYREIPRYMGSFCKKYLRFFGN